jgi:hypothetical protein
MKWFTRACVGSFVATLCIGVTLVSSTSAARNEGVPRAQPSTARPYKAAELLVKFQPGTDELSAASAMRNLGVDTSRLLKPRRT